MISLPASLIRQAKFLLIAAIFILTSACSIKTLYNQLDSLIPSYLEEMVTLDDVLEKKIEQRIQFLINWHRTTQLKDYADWLRTLQQDVNTHLTDKKLFQHAAIVERFWKSVSQKFNKELADFLPSLNSEQRKELFASMTAKNQDFRDDYIDIDEKKRVNSNAERMLENYENWLGDLTEEQKKAITQTAREIRSTAPLRLQQRLLWQQGIHKILEGNEANSFKSERLRVLFADFEKRKSAKMKKREAMNRRIMVRLTLNVTQSLTPDQKAYFISQTNHYIRILTELSENR